MTGKKIGSYLIEQNACDEKNLSQALEIQAGSASRGVYKPLGEILRDAADGATREIVDRCLHFQRIDILLAVPLFENLPREAVVKIAGVAETYALPANLTVFREGDPGDTFNVIISGRVRVFRNTEDDIRNTITVLDPGSGFGEMALLTGEPRSASVETLEPTSLLTIPKNAFDRVLAENPELTKNFLNILAQRLTQANESVVSASVTERAYQRFVSEQTAMEEPFLVGKSRAAVKLLQQIQAAGENDRPVLITGEPGTEKRDAACLVHRTGNRDRPFLLFDAQNVTMISSEKSITRKDSVHLELSQGCALFGHEQGAFSFAKTRRMGLLEVCNGGSLVIEHVEYLAQGIQEKLADFIRCGQFQKHGARTLSTSAVRIIATTDHDPAEQVLTGKLDRQLYEQLSAQTLKIEPLRERRKDLRMIVEHLIERYSERFEKPVRGIDIEGYNQIMKYHWPGNTDELDLVVRRAVNITQTEALTAEDLFIGADPQESTVTYNLLKIEKVRAFLQNRHFPETMQYIGAVALVAVILLGLFGSQAADRNVALALVWGIGEPVVVLSWLFIGRSFCAVCPMGALTERAGRFFCTRLKVPQFLRQYGFYLSGLGLVLVILAEVGVHMHESPRLTAYLLIGVTLCALVSGLLYQRRVWCRYLCPFGRWAGIMASLSLTELRSNRSICNSDCKTHSCYVGDDQVSGCPMYEGTFAIQNNQNCILCGNCIKLCANQSPKINIRIPGSELLAAVTPDRAVTTIILFLIGTQLFRGLTMLGLTDSAETMFGSRLMGAAVLMAVATALSFMLVSALGRSAFGFLTAGTYRRAELMCYGLLPAVFSFEIAYQVELLLTKGGSFFAVFGRQTGFSGELFVPAVGSGGIKLLQVAALVLGSLAALLLTNRLQRKHAPEAGPSTGGQHKWPVVLFTVICLVFFVGS